MVLPITLTYYRGDGGFEKGFSLYQNGAVVDITTLPGGVLIKWWFKAPDGTRKEIDWNGIGEVDGTSNNQYYFDVPYGFFDTAVEYDCSHEVYVNGVLILHNDPMFVVKVLEPAGTSLV